MPHVNGLETCTLNRIPSRPQSAQANGPCAGDPNLLATINAVATMSAIAAATTNTLTPRRVVRLIGNYSPAKIRFELWIETLGS